MIVHIAIFKWKNGTSKDRIKKALDDVRNLKIKCKGVVDIMCGENFSKWSEGFTHAVVVIAKDKKALDGYRNHPMHKLVADEIEEMEEHGIGVDFEV